MILQLKYNLNFYSVRLAEWIPIESKDNSHFNQSEWIMIAGYPQDKGLTQMWADMGHTFVQSKDWVTHDVDTMPGNSGSGCLSHHPETKEWVLRHVHNGFYPDLNLNYATTMNVCFKKVFQG